MAIKTLRFSFDIPISDVLALVAARNDSLHIDVVGDGKEAKIPKQLRNGVAGLLEGPRGIGRGRRAKDENGHAITGPEIVAQVLLAAPEHTATLADIKVLLGKSGLNTTSNSSVAYQEKKGNVKRIAKGVYKATAQGLKNMQKMLADRDVRIGAAS